MKYHIFDISPYINNRGFTTHETYKDGFLSLGQSSLPAEQVTFDSIFYINNVPFVFKKNHIGDNIEMEGQLLKFSVLKVKNIHILGVSSNGDLYDSINLLYDEQLVERVKVYLSDFLSPQPYFEDQLALSFTHLNTRVGIKEHYKPNMWYYNVKLPAIPKINGIKLEDNPSMHIFAITFELSF